MSGRYASVAAASRMRPPGAYKRMQMLDKGYQGYEDPGMKFARLREKARVFNALPPAPCMPQPRPLKEDSRDNVAGEITSKYSLRLIFHVLTVTKTRVRIYFSKLYLQVPR